MILNDVNSINSLHFIAARCYPQIEDMECRMGFPLYCSLLIIILSVAIIVGALVAPPRFTSGRERLSGRSGRNNHRPGGTDDN